MERLRKFNIGVDGAKALRATSILGGVRRKALWVGRTSCNVCGIEWDDKILRIPHTIVCPRGHVQNKIEDEAQLKELTRWGLYRDIAAHGYYGTRNRLGKTDNVVTADEFFSQGVNQQTADDAAIKKWLQSARGLPSRDEASR
jgi:hypothetical protein